MMYQGCASTGVRSTLLPRCTSSVASLQGCDAHSGGLKPMVAGCASGDSGGRAAQYVELARAADQRATV
jgi:hypothetical protein